MSLSHKLGFFSCLYNYTWNKVIASHSHRLICGMGDGGNPSNPLVGNAKCPATCAMCACGHAAWRGWSALPTLRPIRYNVNRREGRTSPPTPSSSSEESNCGGKSWLVPVRPGSCTAPSAFTSAATPSSPIALDEHAAALCRRAGSRGSRPTLLASISVSISRREGSGAGSAGRLPSGSCEDSDLLLPCKKRRRRYRHS